MLIRKKIFQIVCLHNLVLNGNFGPDPFLSISSATLDFQWGFQRNLGKGWLFDYSVGVGIFNSKFYGTKLYPAINIRFAKTIFTGKKKK